MTHPDLFRPRPSRRPGLRLGLLALAMVLLGACNKELNFSLTGPEFGFATLSVGAVNSTTADLSLSTKFGSVNKVPPGLSCSVGFYISTTPLPSSDSFDVVQGEVKVARVTFRPLQLPATKGEAKTTKIFVREVGAGQFAATAAEPDWVEVLSVTPLS